MFEYEINERRTSSRKRRMPNPPTYDRAAYDKVIADVFNLSNDKQVELRIPIPAKGDLAPRSNSAGPYQASRTIDREISRFRAAAKRHVPRFGIHVEYDEEDRKPLRGDDGKVGLRIWRGHVLEVTA